MVVTNHDLLGGGGGGGGRVFSQEKVFSQDFTGTDSPTHPTPKKMRPHEYDNMN